MRPPTMRPTHQNNGLISRAMSEPMPAPIAQTKKVFQYSCFMRFSPFNARPCAKSAGDQVLSDAHDDTVHDQESFPYRKREIADNVLEILMWTEYRDDSKPT